jgi:squalene-hopene/tetraprenyl-beta-curcumene cyclase
VSRPLRSVVSRVHSALRGGLPVAAAMLVAVACGVRTVAAADAAKVGPDPQQLQQVVDKAVHYLSTQGQAADGSFSKQAGIGVTALITTGLLRSGRGVDDPMVAKSLKCIEGYVQPDGGIYTPDTGYKNYETCLGIMCFTEANADGRYKKTIANAEKFLKSIQFGPAMATERNDLNYGGAGYGKHKRPDLSNTSFLVDALKACGRDGNDEAMKAALIFVSNSQNFENEANTAPYAAKNPDGGFYYTPAAGGESMAEKMPNGGLRSYASMTYAGLKSMIYAGVKKDDPRVKAATAWIRKNYDLKTNPGLGETGLYYYYHVFAKALDAMGVDTVEDSAGVKHDWRRDLVEELAKRQLPDGSFINKADRWMESDPNLVTGYVLLALSYCKPAAAPSK